MSETLLPMFIETGVPQPAAMWAGGDARTPILSWLLQWESFEKRRATWAKTGPIWQHVKEQRGEPEFVTRTELTLLEPWTNMVLAFDRQPGGCESMWRIQPKVGRSESVRAACLERMTPLLSGLGALGFFAADYLFGPLPQILLIVTWANVAQRRVGGATLRRVLSPADGVEAQWWEMLDRSPALLGGPIPS